MWRIVDLMTLALTMALLFAQQTTIKTTVPLVVLPVSVTDAKGQFVYGLAPSDFLVLDDGRPRKVQVDDPDLVSAPLAMVVLVQTDDISRSALLKIRKVGTMIQDAVVGANGKVAVITYSDEVKVAQDFTNSADDISKLFRNLKPAQVRKGRMIDAVSKGLDMIESQPEGTRSAMLIIGESKDRGSETKIDDLIPAIQRSGVTIYSLDYSAFVTPFTTKGSEYNAAGGGGSWLLAGIIEAAHANEQDTSKLLAIATGGRILKFETQKKLENDLIRLGSEIHSRYMVSFTPDRDADVSFHKVTVEIKDRPDALSKTRPGYWSIAKQ